MKLFLGGAQGGKSEVPKFLGFTSNFVLLLTFLYIWRIFFGVLIHIVCRKWRKIKKHYYERSRKKAVITN